MDLYLSVLRNGIATTFDGPSLATIAAAAAATILAATMASVYGTMASREKMAAAIFSPSRARVRPPLLTGREESLHELTRVNTSLGVHSCGIRYGRTEKVVTRLTSLHSWRLERGPRSKKAR